MVWLTASQPGVCEVKTSEFFGIYVRKIWNLLLLNLIGKGEHREGTCIFQFSYVYEVPDSYGARVLRQPMLSRRERKPVSSTPPGTSVKADCACNELMSTIWRRSVYFACIGCKSTLVPFSFSKSLSSPGFVDDFSGHSKIFRSGVGHAGA